jgi:transcriptional regulator with XRE-family HTH domain
MDTTALAKLEGRRRGRQANRESGSALGEWVKSTRTAQGVSQRELADRAGLSRSYVCDIEHGRSTKPSFECLENISKALGVDRTDVLRVAGILEPVKAPEENARDRKHLSVYQSLNESNRTAVEAFARYLLSQEQHWVQAKLVDGDYDSDSNGRRLQDGRMLFDIVEV